jgi:metallo-beta-lactamase family protein
MAISATQIFERHQEDFEPEVRKIFDAGQDPFGLPGLHFTRDKAQSIAINAVKSGAIIMAGSGMATGGRIRQHLIHHISRPESSIVFVGYAAAGTLARRIIDGAKEVRILGQQLPVRAEIYTINGFSAHADQKDLLDWQARIAGKRMVVLIHGELTAMQAMAGKLPGKVVIPKLNEEINLT